MGRPTPRAAFSLVELLVALAILAVLIALVASAVQKARASAARLRCLNNMRQIGTALHHHHDVSKSFPIGMRRDGDPYPYLTWLARLLPHLERADLWAQTQSEYQRDSRFYAAPRHAPSAEAVSAFVCPSDGRAAGVVKEGFSVAFTHYLGVSGSALGAQDGVLLLNRAVALGDIRDGASNTLAVGERPPSPDSRWGWWYAGVGQEFTGDADMLLSARGARMTFRTPTCAFDSYPFRVGSVDNICDIFHFWSSHPGGANFAFADGSVRFLSYSANDVLPALATRAGGEGAAVPD
ncbi:MAG TPA: DUF1559 domain-containing protein [Gemmata sp.]